MAHGAADEDRCADCRADCPLARGEVCACMCHLEDETPSLGWD